MPAVGHKYWCGSLTQSEGASKKMFRGLCGEGYSVFVFVVVVIVLLDFCSDLNCI